MRVKALINGREFSFSWDEFEHMMLKKSFNLEVEILEVA